MNNPDSKALWGALFCSLMLTGITNMAAAAEITTPIILDTATTRTETDNVHITNLGTNPSAIATTNTGATLNLSGNINIDLTGLSTPTNILHFTKGTTNLTGNQLNIKAISSGSITGIFADAWIINSGQLFNNAATTVDLTGVGTIIGIKYDTTSYIPTLNTTSIKIHAQGASDSVEGLYVREGILNGNLDIDINGGQTITGASGDLTVNSAINNININSAAATSITGLYTNYSTLKSGTTTNINITDTSTGSKAVTGINIRGNNTKYTTLESGATLNINVASQAEDINLSTKALSGTNGIVIFTSTNSATTTTAAGSFINITMNGLAVNASGQNGTAGITVAGSLNTNGALNIDIQSAGGAGIRVLDAPLDATPTIGKIQLNGDTIVKTNQGYALLSSSYSPNISLDAFKTTTIAVNSNGGSLVQLTGNIDHKTKIYSHFDINLDRADSFLTGSSMSSNTITYTLGIPPTNNLSLTNIKLANGATWNMTGKDTMNTTGNSVVNNLTFANQGLLNMTYGDSASAYSYEQLTAHGWLGDSGKILMNTDLQASFDNKNVAVDSDRIIIKKYTDPANTILSPLSQGTHTIDIKDTSLLTKIPAEGYLLLVSDQTQGTAGFVGGNLIKGGIFKYKPIITDEDPQNYNNVPTNANNWYLTGFQQNGVTEETIINAGLAESRYIAYMNEQDTLIKRLGELRQNDKEQGLWVRIRGANNSVNGYGLSRNSYVSTHLGYDKRLKDDGTTKRYLGLAFNHTNNNFDYVGADGKGQSNVLTIYGTRLGDKGHYLDLVGKIGRMSNDYKYQDHHVEAKNWFYSLSAEYGRSIERAKGWYYEPQVQFTYGHINGASYSGHETNISADSINSALLRAGILFGRKYHQDIPEKSGSYYAKLFYNHEFGGDVKARMTDVYGDRFDFKHSYSGSWLTVGLGTSLNLNKKTNLYLDVEKAFGGKISGGWAWQGGVRWRF